MDSRYVRILQPGDEPALEAFLLPRIESSMFLLGNLRAAGLQDSGQAYEGSYAALFEGKEIIGVVAHCWNGNLVFQAPGCENMLWRAAAEASERRVAGLIGPSDQVALARRALEIPDSLVQLDEQAKLYSLRLDDLIVPDALNSGQVVGRRMEPGDVDLLTEWRVGFSVEAGGATDSLELWERSRATVRRLLEEGVTWVLERGGEAVACSSFNAVIETAVQIGGVWTPPGLRERGYGRCAVATSLLDARSERVEKAILFTGEENLAAQRVYQALGFRHIGDYHILLLEPPVDIDSLRGA